MKNSFSRQALAMGVLLSGLCVTASLHAQSQTTEDIFRSMQAQGVAKVGRSAPTVPGQSIYYYNGDSRVDLVLALDELNVADSDIAAITQEGAEADATGAGLQAIAFTAHGRPNEYFLLVNPNANVTSLEENASALKSLRGSTRRVRAVAYMRDDSSRDVADKRVITNSFSVKLTGGQNIDELAKKYNAGCRRESFLQPGHIHSRDGRIAAPVGGEHGKRDQGNGGGNCLRGATDCKAAEQEIRAE